MDLEGKTTIITGAAGGIGRASAIEFAAQGATVTIVDTKQAELAETERLVRENNGRVRARVVDVTRASEVESLVREVIEQDQKIDVLFNNAGILGGSTLCVDQTEEAFDLMLNVNIKGVFLGIRAVLPHMIERRAGSIISTASVGGVRGYRYFSAYCAAKHAVVGLTRSVAAEVGQFGVRVNALAPGPTDTPMWHDIGRTLMPESPTGVISTFVPGIPMGRYCEPAEQARAACFLASDRASFVNGAVLLVDGGMVYAG